MEEESKHENGRPANGRELITKIVARHLVATVGMEKELRVTRELIRKSETAGTDAEVAFWHRVIAYFD